MLKSSLAVLMLLVLALGSTGCVSQGHADEQREVIRTLQDRIVELESQIEQLNSQIQIMRERGSDFQQERQELTQMRDEAQQRLEELLAENERLRNQLAQRGNQLPEELSDALKQFAEQNPDLAEYDEQRGVVRLRSDITFGLGSAELSSTARNAIPRLARVLQRDVARDYEVQVVGHTDAVPISKESTKQKHPTNWHLSVHRAIAVRSALNEAGLPDVRTSVTGYSKYRPVAQNTRRGAERNRRVELYLKPMLPVNENLIQRTGSTGTGNNNNSGSNTSNRDSGPTADEAMFK